MNRRHLLWLTVAFEGGMAVLGGVLGWLTGASPWRNLHWQPDDLLLTLAATLPLLLAFFILYRWPLGPLRGIKDISLRFIAPLFARCTTADLAVISLLAGVGEEVLFRGFLMPALAAWLGDASGLAISSLVFGALHALTLTYAVLATLAGLWFGWFALLTDNLLVVIIAHAVYDFVALLFLVRSARGIDVSPAETALPEETGKVD